MLLVGVAALLGEAISFLCAGLLRGGRAGLEASVFVSPSVAAMGQGAGELSCLRSQAALVWTALVEPLGVERSGRARALGRIRRLP